MHGFSSIFHARFHRKNERNPVHSFYGLVHSFSRRCWFISKVLRLFRKIFAYFASYSAIIFDGLALGWYDADGSPIGMQYRTTSMAKGDFYTFWFEKNLQGDIVAVYNESGTKVYTYQYDAWGNCTATPVSSIGSNIYAQYNPFRYRGYYYDMETGLYHTINTANKMNNQINSVSPKYWGTFKELALGVLDYGWNQMTNEILYWTGN